MTTMSRILTLTLSIVDAKDTKPSLKAPSDLVQEAILVVKE